MSRQASPGVPRKALKFVGFALLLAAIAACFGLLAKEPSMRPFGALLLLFLFRQACQASCALPIPRGMIFRKPGFPSLLVTYDVANDFFFSGHTAIAALGAIELAQISPWLGLAGALIALVDGATVIILRAHYTMDVLAAIAASWCAFSLSVWLQGPG